MAKQTNLELEARTYTPYSRWSFYRPHARVVYDGTITNPVTGEITSPPSRAKQEFKDQCDMNNIIKAYRLTGQINHVAANAAQGRYEDLPDEFDLQQSLNVVREADAAFASLPAKLRDRFGNDPAKFLGFLSNPENIDEARRLGIINSVKPESGGNNPPPPPSPSPAAPPPAPEPPK
jgi:phage internal scaffolding protein